jgi:hypothetical protein
MGRRIELGGDCIDRFSNNLSIAHDDGSEWAAATTDDIFHGQGDSTAQKFRIG